MKIETKKNIGDKVTWDEGGSQYNSGIVFSITVDVEIDSIDITYHVASSHGWKEFIILKEKDII